MGVVSQTVAVGQILATTPGIQYDTRKYTWIGRINSNVEVEHTWHASGIKSIEDAKKREVIVAGTGPTSSSVVMPRLMNELIGTKFKVVTGFQGPTSAQLALRARRGRGHRQAVVEHQGRQRRLAAREEDLSDRAIHARAPSRAAGRAGDRRSRRRTTPSGRFSRCSPAVPRSAPRCWRRPACRRRPSPRCGKPSTPPCATRRCSTRSQERRRHRSAAGRGTAEGGRRYLRYPARRAGNGAEAQLAVARSS